MKRIFSVALIYAFGIVNAYSMCDTVWDGDKIIANTKNASSSFILKLREKSNNSERVNEVPITHLRAYYEASEKISPMAGIKPKFIICSDKDPNAFATKTKDGDVIGITLGIMALTGPDKDMAATIIGHEIGHHSKNHMDGGRAAQAVIGILGAIITAGIESEAQKKGADPGIGQAIGQLGTTLVSRKYSRNQEYEADEAGFQYILKAGYDPSGATRLASLFSQKFGRGSTGFFDTHPGWSDRRATFEELIAKSPEAQQIIAAKALSPTIDNQEASTLFKSAIASIQAKDFQTGFANASKSAALGYMPAKSLLGTMYLRGDGVNKNISEAVRLHKEAADVGVPQSLYQMALFHRRGEGVVKSDETAASYYKKAMDKGHTPSIIGLAQLYRVGSGVEKNQDESFRLYKIAADKNNSDAYIGLALAYFNGEGVPINFSEGIVYLQKAVDANLPAGKHFMGDIKINGKYGQQIDRAQGLNLLKESAERNYPPALLQLGRIYENGDGVVPSIDEARKLYAKAASFNYNPAIIALNRLSLPPPPPVALSMPLPPPSPPSPPTAPLKADTSASTNSFEAQAWNEAVKANSIQAFEAYINAFPNGSNVAVAKINLLGLKARK